MTFYLLSIYLLIQKNMSVVLQVIEVIKYYINFDTSSSSSIVFNYLPSFLAIEHQ